MINGNGDFYWRTYQSGVEWLRRHGLEMITPLSKAKKLLTLNSTNFSSKTMVESNVHNDTEALLDQSSVDTAYLEALKVNRAHQAERDLQRQREANQSTDTSTDWVDYVDLTQVQSYATKSVAPSNRANKNRKKKQKSNIINWRQEMNAQEFDKMSKYHHLYGRDPYQLSIILQSETELQSDFERFCDRYQPSFWPHLPTRIVFNAQ